MIYNIVATSQGGTATVTYDYPQGGDQVLWPTFSHRTESGSPNAVYTYNTDGSITRPDGTKLILSGPDTELRSSGGATLSKTVSTLTTDSGGSTVLQSMIGYDDIGQQTKVDFDYDQYGNVVNKREYGCQIGGAWKVRRRTHYSYVNWEPYLSAYISNRVTETDVYDALQNTSDADDVLVAKTAAGYDSYGAMGGMENYGGTAAPPGHLSSYDTSKTTRGNLTGVTTYSDLSGSGVTRSSQIDIFGGVTKAQVSCCNVKSFTKTEATYWAAPSQTTSGDSSGVHLTSSAVYEFNTLQATSQTDPDNQTSSYSYDAAQRPTGLTAPTGASGTIIYNVFGEKTSSTISYTEGGVNKSVSTSAVYDGWGQMTSTVDTNGAQVNYTYDNNGSNAQRRFAYDRWGNRTGAWDAVSGGTQIQSITLQQSGGAPTNQIQSVTSGSTVSYIYDAAGNVTNDGAHSYTYDAENRIVSVDGGSTATYSYDQTNQRYKKTVGATVTHNIWQDSQVIAEHNGSTGASTADYIYSGSRMIAKAAGLTTQYFLSDRLSERLTLNTSGTVIGRQGHLPFGEDFAESGTQEKHHLTSYERDSESTTDYSVNRQYSQTVGRFMRVDPYQQAVGNPQSHNRYAYVENNPTNAIDRLGLDTCMLVKVADSYDGYKSDRLGGDLFDYRLVCFTDSPDSSQKSRSPKGARQTPQETVFDIAYKASLLLSKPKCAALLSTDITNSNMSNPITPSTILGFYQRMSSRGNLRAAPLSTFSAVAQTTDAGNNAFTEFGRAFFQKDVGGWTGFHHLNPEQAQIMTALHELGHATGAEAANHDNDDIEAEKKYNEKIIKSCLK